MTHYGQDDDDHHHDDDDGSEEELSEEDSDLESLVSVSDVHWNVPNTIGVGSRLEQKGPCKHPKGCNCSKFAWEKKGKK